jgi:hypothetical protein
MIAIAMATALAQPLYFSTGRLPKRPSLLVSSSMGIAIGGHLDTFGGTLIRQRWPLLWKRSQNRPLINPNPRLERAVLGFSPERFHRASGWFLSEPPIIKQNKGAVLVGRPFSFERLTRSGRL